MSSVEVTVVIAYPKKRSTPMHSTKSLRLPSQQASPRMYGSRSYGRSIGFANPNYWSEESGNDGWWRWCRFVFQFASFVVSAFTRFRWITSNSAVHGDAAGRRPIWWCWVLKLPSDCRSCAHVCTSAKWSMVQHCQHFLRAFFFHDTCNQTSQTCDSPWFSHHF